MPEPTHPVLDAIRPLLDRIGAAVVAPAEMHARDVPVAWEGVTVAGIRLADDSEPGGLEGIIAELERTLGGPLAELSRAGKQQAVRQLEEDGAFSYRKSVEVVAAALGVSRFTVYNYLNRDRA